MFDILKCEYCEKGRLIHDMQTTANVWLQPEVFRIDDIDKILDGIIGEFLVFNCSECGAEFRYTYKEIEKLYRKELSKRILTAMSVGDISDPGLVRNADRIFIYCGKCSGYDGKGSCPDIVYNDCKLKRLPCHPVT